MRSINVLHYLKEIRGDGYAMDVLYNCMKQDLLINNFSYEIPFSLKIDGRFFGEPLSIFFRSRKTTPLHSLSLLLSIRIISLDPSFLGHCEDDSLIFSNYSSDKFDWIVQTSNILNYWNDSDVRVLFYMLHSAYYFKPFTVEILEKYKAGIQIPEYRNSVVYFEHLAEISTGINQCVISNNAFLEAEMEVYAVPSDILYIGNTAFAYCKNLKRLQFDSEVMFGAFPIIECDALEKIVVPANLITYYKKTLPYYRDIICTEEETENIEATQVEEDRLVYTVTQENDHAVNDSSMPTKNAGSDYFKFDQIFDKRSSSYKFLWLISIMSIIKEKKEHEIPFKNLLIRMASIGWLLIFKEDVFLGKNDMLRTYLKRVKDKMDIASADSYFDVETCISQDFENKGLSKILTPLLNNVPYRFLSPWIRFVSNADVRSKSNIASFHAPYALLHDGIKLKEEWMNFILANWNNIIIFISEKFTEYLAPMNSDTIIQRVIDEWLDNVLRHKQNVTAESAPVYLRHSDNCEVFNNEDSLKKVAEETIDVNRQEDNLHLGEDSSFPKESFVDPVKASSVIISADTLAIENEYGLCYVFDNNHEMLFISAGIIKKFGNSLYRFYYSRSELFVKKLKVTDNAIEDGDIIINAKENSQLFKKLARDQLFDRVEDLYQNSNGDGYLIEIKNIIYNQNGMMVYKKDSNVIKNTDNLKQENQNRELIELYRKSLIYEVLKKFPGEATARVIASMLPNLYNPSLWGEKYISVELVEDLLKSMPEINNDGNSHYFIDDKLRDNPYLNNEP